MLLSFFTFVTNLKREKEWKIFVNILLPFATALLVFLLWELVKSLQKWRKNRQIKKEVQKLSSIANNPSDRGQRTETVTERDLEQEHRDRLEAPPTPLFDGGNLELLKIGMELENFSMEEFLSEVEVSRKKVTSWISSMVNFGLAKEFSYGNGEEKRFYLIRKSRIRKVCKILISFLKADEGDNEGERRSLGRKATEISISESELKTLLNKGGRGIYFIGFNDQVGPLLEYKVLSSKFAERMERNPSELAKIATALSLDVEEFTLPNGSSLLCKKVNSPEGGKQHFILLEKANSGNSEGLRDLLHRIGDQLNGKEFNEENIKEVLSQSLMGNVPSIKDLKP